MVTDRGNKLRGDTMTVTRCDMCFQDKAELQPVIPHAPANVCKACAYKAKQVIGFLEYHGIVFVYQPKMTDELKSKVIKEKS